MEKLKIYQTIRDIACQLQQNNATYTRADLAYDLQKLGISKDSIEVSMLVWEAFQHFKKDSAIKAAFYDNEKKHTLVDEYQVDSLLEENNAALLFPLLQDKLAKGNRSLTTLEHSVTQSMSGNISQVGMNALNTIVGAQGVAKVKSEATSIFNGYSQLVGNYDDAKSQIKYLIADFVKLRGFVCDIYRQYATVLVDAFGDSVKAVSPELFDFDTIEWLDVQGMLQNVKLDYDRITNKCSLLMGDISDSFAQSLKTASASYRSAGNKQVGLLLAGLNMVSHYLDAGQKTTELQQELLVLKNSVKHDTTLIKGDLGRLLIIYKSLNDLYIPQSEAFCRFSHQVLSGEWRQLEDALYADENIRKLKQERDKLLAEYKEVEKDMADEEMNIAYYSTHIAECNQLLGSMHTQYQQAKDSKPSKPFFLVNLFTLGASGKRYNRDIYEWNMACQPVITQFEDLQVDIKLDNDELTLQQNELKKNEQRLRVLKQELNRQNKLMMDSIKVNPSIRLKMLPHLEAIVKLLRMAREIANSKLDAKLTKTVTITRQNTEMPEYVKQNISRFTQIIRENATMDNGTMLKAVNYTSETPVKLETNLPTSQGTEAQASQITEEELTQLTATGNEAIQRTINLLESWGQLQIMQAQSAATHKEYDRELEKLQDEFWRNLADIDNKSAVLRESLRRINTAQNHEQLKEGLLSLAGKNDTILSAQEWEDFLNGNKTIEL